MGRRLTALFNWPHISHTMIVRAIWLVEFFCRINELSRDCPFGHSGSRFQASGIVYLGLRDSGFWVQGVIFGEVSF